MRETYRNNALGHLDPLQATPKLWGLERVYYGGEAEMSQETPIPIVRPTVP